MTNLLEKLGLKKKELPKNQTILTDDDMVKLDSGGMLYLSREEELYLVLGDFSEIDFLNPNPLVSLKHFGPIEESSLKEFRPYKELRDSLN